MNILSSNPYYRRFYTFNLVGKVFLAHIRHFLHFHWKFSILLPAPKALSEQAIKCQTFNTSPKNGEFKLEIIFLQN